MPPQPFADRSPSRRPARAQKAVRTSDKKKKKRRRKESFSIYIYKVLKSSASGHRAYSSKAMSIMNRLCQRHLREDRSRGVASGPLQQAFHRSPSPGGSRTAVRLLLPGELAKHAVSEGTKAVTKYTSSK
uniref:Putative histone 2b n=1 Tax=Ixodes ricinus TaxID=34613 RepID=V5I411_IXORI